MKKLIKNKTAFLITIAALLVLPLLGFLDTRYFLNLTKSMPIGIYKKIDSNKIGKNSIIVFKYFGKNTKLIKKIAGQPGDEFCHDGIDTIWSGQIKIAQQNIQKYPSYNYESSHCFVLDQDELYVLGEHEDSFDSRYFGPIKRSQIISSVEPFFIVSP